MGIWAEKDFIVNGTIFNWEIDTSACFFAVGRDLRCKNLVESSAVTKIARDRESMASRLLSSGHSTRSHRPRCCQPSTMT
ncbi:hypothetical protein [Bradyrhizobium sp. OAE829]|uniref:hypothetical protein n=1 Tax=Bradyrhizobium sp. OAE829 TaxID=2663807 RepID=UPI00178A3FCA